MAVIAKTSHNTAETRFVGAVGIDFAYSDHGALQRLTGIRNPTLVIQGDNDLMIPTKLSHLVAGLIPDAQIRIYPDAAHGFLFQYPSEVAAAVNEFLTADDENVPVVPGA
jgi:pimeloyl-ACP methyl ester carboxylesterase